MFRVIAAAAILACGLFGSSPATADQELSDLLARLAEVAARFGFPDDVGGTDDGGVFWNYHHFGPDGARDGGTLFVFMDGRVAWHEFSVPNLRLR